MGTIILRGGTHDGKETDTPVPGTYVALDGERYEETEEEQRGRKVFEFKGRNIRVTACSKAGISG